jgi:peptidoglycan/xylan/chitin deacetylase (PgdA/CDA1 family)
MMLIYGAANIHSQLFVSAMCRLDSPREIAITFDDGPHPQTTEILNLLDKYHAKATFFVIGKNVEKHPEILHEILIRGHAIGNHSYHHGFWFSLKNSTQMIDEMKNTEEIILKKFNYKLHIFRPPYGITNPAVAKAAKAMNYRVIGWNLRSLDTQIKSPEKLKKRVLGSLKGGDIVLLHDHASAVIPTLESILKHLEQNGLKSVKIG